MSASKRSGDLEQVSLFTRQLSVLLDAHVPLVRALDCYAHGVQSGELQNCVADVSARVSSGHSLSGALGSYPRWFSATYLAIVKSGEASGGLSQALMLLADLLERQVRLSKKVVSALTYPVVLLTVALACTGVFVFWVFPQMLPMYGGLTLPWPTQLLIAGSRAAVPLLLALAAAVSLARAIVPGYLQRHPAQQVELARRALRLPVCGLLLRRLALARVLYVFRALLEAGLPLLTSLTRAADAAGNSWVREQLLEAVRQVGDGETLQQALDYSEVFPPGLLQMLAAGEEAASLSSVAGRLAEWCDSEAEQALGQFTVLLEPILMAGMGLGVGFVLVSAMLPTISLINSL